MRRGCSRRRPGHAECCWPAEVRCTGRGRRRIAAGSGRSRSDRPCRRSGCWPGRGRPGPTCRRPGLWRTRRRRRAVPGCGTASTGRRRRPARGPAMHLSAGDEGLHRAGEPELEHERPQRVPEHAGAVGETAPDRIQSTHCGWSLSQSGPGAVRAQAPPFRHKLTDIRATARSGRPVRAAARHSAEPPRAIPARPGRALCHRLPQAAVPR